MTRYNKIEDFDLQRDGSETEDILVVGETDDAPYQLLSVPRWNDDYKVVERYYEVYNRQTGVVESRLKTNLLTAATVFESIVALWQDLDRAGTAKALEEEGTPAEAPNNGPTLQ